MSSPKMEQLREHLMATLASLRDRDNPMEPDRARAVATVAGVLVDTARVEVEYIKSTGGDGMGFFDSGRHAPAIGHAPPAHNPFQKIANRS